MPDALIQLAEDAKTFLSGLTLSQEFNVTRHLAPSFILAEMTGIEVVVRPAQKTGEDFTRATHKRGLTIDVSVTARVESTDNTHTDPMVQLIGEIENNFVGNGSTIQPWRSPTDDLTVSQYTVIPFDEEVLYSRNQFTGFLSLTFDQYT